MIAFQSLYNVILRHKQIKLALYADDAIIFSKCKNTTTLNNKFKKVLNEIQIWGNASGATLAVSKCKVFHICKKQRCTYPPLSYNDIDIESISFLKILGLTIDK